ncbi:MAG: four helix bundle protein [Vicinamibacterales bacterium]
MAGARDVTELGAWVLANDLKKLAYALARRPHVERDRRFREQLVDAAASAPRNIAEGFGRYTHREFARFVRIAKGSEAEVLNHFRDAADRGYLDQAELPAHEHAARKALKAATGLLRYLEDTPDLR